MKPSFLPPRIRPGVGFFVVFFSLSLLTHSARADDGAAWLPSADDLVDLAAEVSGFSAASFAERASLGQASAKRCTLASGDFSCRCVTIETETATLQAKTWSRRGGSTQAEQLSVSPRDEAGARYFVETWQAEDSKDDAERTHRLESTVVMRPSRSPESLSARRVTLSTSAQAPERLVFEGLAWHDRGLEWRSRSCGASWPQPASQPAFAAAEARLGDGRWTIRGFDVVGLPPFLADFEAERPAPVGGFLPPTLIATDEAVSLQASYLIGELGVAPQVVVAPTRWYGLGVGVTSAVEAPAGAPPALAADTQIVDAQLRWSERAGGLRPALLGDGFWGTPYTHFATSMEFAAEEEFWGVDRFRRDAPFRPWRLSRAGMSLSGPAHHLSARVVHPAAIDAAADSTEDIVGANLLLAVHHELGDGARADFGAEHQSFVNEDDAAHATTLRVGAEQVIGSQGALYVRPAVRAWLQAGFGTATSGIATSTRSQLVATADAGASFRGRFRGLTHRLEPGVVVAREVAGFSRDGLGGQQTWHALSEQESSWSLGALYVDQGLDFDAFSIELPVALVFEGAGLGQAIEHRPWALGAATLRAGRGELAVRTACPGLCDELWWTASAAATLGAFELVYMSGDLGRGVLLPLTWRSAIEDGWALLHGFQGEAQASRRRFDEAHLANVGWRRGRFSSRLRGIYWRERDRLGVSFGNTYAFPALGWSVGVEVAAGPEDGDWGALVGLSAMP